VDYSGIFPALTTPFANDGHVSLADLKHNIRHYNETDVAGYVALGSTGESVLLTRAEADAVLSTVREAAAKDKKLIAGTGAESTAETIERTKRAAELGYHAALVKTPHYYKPAYKAEVLIAHYRRVADESPIPVLLYSVPQFTGVALEAAEVVALSEHKNIIGIKESSPNLQRIGEMIKGTPASFYVFLGAAGLVCQGLEMGARGAILALASALPELCASLYQRFLQGHSEEAQKLHNLLVPASKLIISELGIAGVKYVMDQRGYRGGLPRLPLLPLSQQDKKRVQELLGMLEPAAARA